jgi:carbon monoxide dehydrogenase subunit G
MTVGMQKIEHIIEITASPDAVWEILTDSSYLPKLYPDALSTQVDPPGRSHVGQMYTTLSRVGRRKVEVLSELTQLEPKSKLVTRSRQGGIFKFFEQSVTMQPSGSGTRVRMTFEYEYAMGLVGKVLNAVLIERLLRDNLDAYAANLKEICELLPMPN